MPCDTIIQSKVSFSMTCTDVSLLTKAMEELGWIKRKTADMSFYKRQGEFAEFIDGQMKLTITSAESSIDERMNEIKRAYSKQVIETTAKKFGWKLKQRKSPGKFTYQKG